MEILHYPLMQFHVHLVIQNELFNWLPLETNMICSSTIYVQVTCSFTRFVLLQKSCTWRGSSTFEILAAEISYIHCNPIQSTKPQFRIFFPQYAVTPTSRGLERNTYLVHANARRLIKLNKKSLNYKVEQKFVLTFICSSPVVTIDLLTWQLDSVNGNCENYPGIPMTLAKLLKKTITFSKWASKKQLVTTKRVQKEYFFFVHRNNHNGRSHRTLEKIYKKK